MSGLIVQGDATSFLASLPEGRVDLILTDPPYGVTALAWDRRGATWLKECARVLAPGGSVWVFGSMRSLLALELSGWTVAQDIVWEKHNGSGLQADRFRRVHEHALHLYRGAWADVWREPQYTLDATPRLVRRRQKPAHFTSVGESTYRSEAGGPRLMRSVIRCRSRQGRAVHPTEKPIEVLLPLVAYSCRPGGVVLDPFAGSGSTGVAALRLERRFVGVELDRDYCAIARQRIQGGELFASSESVEICAPVLAGGVLERTPPKEEL